MSKSATERDDTATRLVDALNEDRFVLHQQAIVAVRGGTDEAYQEIFVRFKEEEEKLLPPGTFIPVLESYRLMHVLDRWVVNRVIKWIHAERRHNAGWSAPCCSINLSNESIVHPDFPHFVKQQMQKGRISGRKLAFEIAEEDAHAHRAGIERLSGELRPAGCRLTLTGYSGRLIPPRTLQSHGIDSIKMDVDIVTTLHNNPESFKQAREIRDACESCGVQTIAELVERPETLERVKALGVHYVQGYGVSLPVPLYSASAQAQPRADETLTLP